MTAAAFDYESLADDAQEIIDEFGREATLTRAARVTAAAPGSKPWVPIQGDAAAAPAQSIDVTAVFLSLDRQEKDGQTVEAKSQGILIGSGVALPEEVGPDWQLVDGDRIWEVLASKPLKPGPTLMLYKLELAL